MTWKLVFAKAAQKDAQKLARAGLKPRAERLLAVLRNDPFANPPNLVPGTQRTPIELPTGETRKFLEDGDEIQVGKYKLTYLER